MRYIIKKEGKLIMTVASIKANTANMISNLEKKNKQKQLINAALKTQ